MTIFANCHIFLKIVIFVKYDKKKTYGRGAVLYPTHPGREGGAFDYVINLLFPTHLIRISIKTHNIHPTKK